MQFHSVYLQHRQHGMSYRDFQRLWRSHGDYAASVPAFWDEVERYVQNDPIENSNGLPGHTDKFDALGELFYTSYQNWLSIRDVMWHQVAPDEKRVFAGPPPIAVRGARTVHQRPVGACKLFTFASYRADISADEREAAVAQYLAETQEAGGFGNLLSGLTVTRAQIHNPQSGMDNMAQTASSRDILFIFHFDSEKAARSALGSAAYARIECAENKFLEWSSRIIMLTHAWVLKGKMG